MKLQRSLKVRILQKRTPKILFNNQLQVKDTQLQVNISYLLHNNQLPKIKMISPLVLWSIHPLRLYPLSTMIGE